MVKKLIITKDKDESDKLCDFFINSASCDDDCEILTSIKDRWCQSRPYRYFLFDMESRTLINYSWQDASSLGELHNYAREYHRGIFAETFNDEFVEKYLKNECKPTVADLCSFL